MTCNLIKYHDYEHNSHCSELCKENEAEGIETLGYTLRLLIFFLLFTEFLKLNWFTFFSSKKEKERKKYICST